jgi:hypothetical protein
VARLVQTPDLVEHRPGDIPRRLDQGRALEVREGAFRPLLQFRINGRRSAEGREESASTTPEPGKHATETHATQRSMRHDLNTVANPDWFPAARVSPLARRLRLLLATAQSNCTDK